MSPRSGALISDALVLDLVPTTIWATAPDGALTYINRFGRQRLGVELDPLGGTSILDCVDPADRPRAHDQWSELRSDADGWSSEFRMRGAGEGALRMMMTARAARDRSGRLLGWVGTCVDVEDERAATDALRRSGLDMGLLLAEADTAARRERLRLLAEAEDSVAVPLERATRDLAVAISTLRTLLATDRAGDP